MAKPSGVSAAQETTFTSRSLSKGVRRRAAAVSEKLVARGLGAFVWQKKVERDLSRGSLPDIVSLRSERHRYLARRKEAGRMKVSAASRRSSPPPIPILPLARAAEEEAKEAAFLLEQSRLRAETRFGYGRPKPIDVLVKSVDGTRLCAVMAFHGASLEDLKELGKEIAEHVSIDRANGTFWESAKIVCDAEIAKAAGTAGHGEKLLHSAILADLKSVVECKSTDELYSMQQTITVQMAADEAMVVEHWQGVTELIRVDMARKYLVQNYSTSDDAAPTSDNEDEEPERADDGDSIIADDEEGSESLCPVALPDIPLASELRKPNYITRVRSGYEWNKYNRVHYDHDHPPPKIVRGYKFVVCYPDLAVAGTKTPEYAIHEDGESGETCIIRFHAGPPYEDIAFRIVNKEWEPRGRRDSGAPSRVGSCTCISTSGASFTSGDD